MKEKVLEAEEMKKRRFRGVVKVTKFIAPYS